MNAFHLIVRFLFGSTLIIGGCSGRQGQDNSSTAPSTPSTALSAPASVAVVAGVRNLTVSWGNADGATSYNLYYSTSPDVSPLNGIKVAKVSSPYTLAGLSKDVPYYVIVTAASPDKESAASTCVVEAPHTISNQIGTSGHSDYGSAVSADKFGNLYVVGNTNGEFDGHPMTGFGDIFVIKYDISGAKKWSRQVGAAAAYSNASGVVVDQDGYIYVTGTTGGSLDGNTKIGSTDLFLLKYDTNGGKIWSRQIGAVGAQITSPSLALENTGTIILTGATNGNLAGGTITGTQDLFIAKLDKNGYLQWLQMQGVINQYTGATSVAVDGAGDIILAGSSCGGFDGITATGICDLLLIKYDTTGRKYWTQMVGAAGAYTNVRSLAIDSAGNSYVAGTTGGNYDGITKPAWGDNMFLTKFDKNGLRQWSELLSGGFYAYGNAVTADSKGNAYVTGNTGNPIDGNSAIGQADMFVVKYDTNGNKKWSKQLGVSYSSTSANGITVDGIGGGNLFIVGSANGDIFTHAASSSYNNVEFFLAGIDSETGEY